MTEIFEKKDRTQALEKAADGIEEQYDRSTRERFTLQKVQRVLESTVGELADFVPFSWRHPVTLTGQKKVSKMLRNIVSAESERRDLVPAQKPEDK